MKKLVTKKNKRHIFDILEERPELKKVNAKADLEAVKSMSDDTAKVRQFAQALPAAGVHIFVNDEEAQLRSSSRTSK